MLLSSCSSFLTLVLVIYLDYNVSQCLWVSCGVPGTRGMQATCSLCGTTIPPMLNVHLGKIQVNFHTSRKREVPSRNRARYVDNRKFGEQPHVHFETSRRRECCRCRDNYKQLQGTQNTPLDEKRPTECGGETPRCPTRISRNGRACVRACVVL